MEGDRREFHLNAKQVEYVTNRIQLEPILQDSLQPERSGILLLSRATRDDIVEQLGTLLQKGGFDTNWRATEEGLMIESIIDVLTAERP